MVKYAHYSLDYDVRAVYKLKNPGRTPEPCSERRASAQRTTGIHGTTVAGNGTP
jgi:hypothetical protein